MDGASTWEIARLTKTPVVLVVDARGAALSILAVIEGFRTFMPQSCIRGVILNRCSAGTYRMLEAAIQQRFDGRSVRWAICRSCRSAGWRAAIWDW